MSQKIRICEIRYDLKHMLEIRNIEQYETIRDQFGKIVEIIEEIYGAIDDILNIRIHNSISDDILSQIYKKTTDLKIWLLKFAKNYEFRWKIPELYYDEYTKLYDIIGVLIYDEMDSYETVENQYMCKKLDMLIMDSEHSNTVEELDNIYAEFAEAINNLQ